ncbi:hypothetical protein CC1G_05832 [Coprinopsis cinerea okayama7|uniref:Uncharacterized protein n=1 Tax=Coprinopsis cinerea (strain Okayama-7 / 130 / ATCC MYA-4618 / FGSC 9003) TaxID=240176 RepID=A8NLI5_COPC7|nr:hypothetical protein CC1G_05832 [Coprinopsis cinerea okayama7\|eukprot:XP_001834695.1 hypothetical protein CC1G_05832 [Coprinopsis cinerea okayama7\
MARPPISGIFREKLVLGAKLEVLRSQESDYERLIKQLTDLKATVTHERRNLEERVKELDALGLPINWLPNELIGQILAIAVELEVSERPESSPKPLVVPVLLSQVCRRWRDVARSTPQIWSNLHFRLYSLRDVRRNQNFVSRSGTVPLKVRIWNTGDANSQSLLGLGPASERGVAVNVIDILKPLCNRIQRLEVGTRSPEGIVPVIKFLNDPAWPLPLLEFASLSIISARPPLFTSASRALLRNNELQTNAVAPALCNLKHLKFEEVPITTLPSYYIANLSSLELVFGPRKTGPTSSHSLSRYYLKLSSVLRILSQAQRLEELTLSNTVPIFDVVSPDGTEVSGPSGLEVVRMLPVKLEHLKTINWNYPTAGDVYRVMRFLQCPAVERLDLFLDGKHARQDPLLWRGYVEAANGSTALPMAAIQFPSLRDLTFQCPDDDYSSSALRKFAFPVLEKFELINVDRAPKSTKEDTISKPWPSLPRIESIFRDPRLFHLTHLTLSYFQFTIDHRRAEAVLGYMPVLTSLSLDSCLGVENLIRVLEDKAIIPLAFHSPSPSANARTRRGVKVCPRLESLSFWGCDDLDLPVLLSVVCARKGDDNGAALGPEGHSPSAATPNGVGTSVTGAATTAPGGGKSSEQKVMGQAAQILGRKIRPLRKSARQAVVNGGGALGGGEGGNAPSVNIVSGVLAAQEALNPSPISYIRIHDCRLISEEAALSLKEEHGVTDVIWTALSDDESVDDSDWDGDEAADDNASTSSDSSDASDHEPLSSS